MPPPGLDHMSQPDPGSFIAVQTKPQNSAERHGDSAGQYDERTELLGGYNRHAESQRLPEDSSTKVPLTNRAKGQQKEQYRHPREDTGSGDKNKRVFSEEAERSSMYEMEEGNLRKRSSMSSSGSSELDREMLDSVFSKKVRSCSKPKSLVRLRLWLNTPLVASLGFSTAFGLFPPIPPSAMLC